jgi:hypothetical protein
VARCKKRNKDRTLAKKGRNLNANSLGPNIDTTSFSSRTKPIGSPCPYARGESNSENGFSTIFKARLASSSHKEREKRYWRRRRAKPMQRITQRKRGEV